MKIKTKLCALLLAVLTAFGAASCSTADQSWSAKMGDESLPVGVYVYLFNAAISAAEQEEGVDSSVSLLDQQIDGMSAEEWIRQRAESSVREILYLRRQLDELGIPLTEDEQESAESMAASMWGYIPDSVKKYVSQDSFVIAYGEYNVMYAKLFEAIYGEGGSQAVSDDELKAYFEDTYYDFDYIFSSLAYKEDTELEDEEEDTAMTEEETAARRELFEGYAEQITAGELTLEDAAEDFKAVIGSEDDELKSELYSGEYLDSYFPSEIHTNLDEMADGEVRAFEVTGLSSGIVLLRKNAISDAADEYLETEGNRDTLLSSMKAEEFYDAVEAGAAALEGVTLNTDAFATYHASEFYTFTPSSTDSSEE